MNCELNVVYLGVSGSRRDLGLAYKRGPFTYRWRFLGIQEIAGG
jgi:hypothetical protein